MLLFVAFDQESEQLDGFQLRARRVLQRGELKERGRVGFQLVIVMNKTRAIILAGLARTVVIVSQAFIPRTGIVLSLYCVTRPRLRPSIE